jgi:AT-rich interactive domain-containing protein 1
MMRPPQRGGKPFAMPPPQGPQPINKMPNQYGPHGPSHMQQLPHHPHQQPHMQGHLQGQQFQQGPPGMSQKRELIFPPDTVESTQPMLYRRKRMTKHDVGPVDPWRIFMSLRSGLLAESTWAIDVLNVLLFDDSSIAYFGLVHLPGLLNLLLEHFQKSLADMFETKTMSNVAAIKDASDEECNKNGGDNNKLSSNLISNSDTGDTRCNKHDIHMPANREEENSSVDLGAVTVIPNPNEHLVVLKSTFNYTLQSRKGVPVKMQDSSNDIFVLDNHRDWDKISSQDCFLKATVGDDPFNVGQEPNTIEYIMNSFKAEYAHIPFARFIKTTKNSDGSEKIRKPSELRPSAVKRMRLSSEEEREVEEMTKKLYNTPKQVTNNTMLKKEPNNPDADCRQVDMELEKLTNGPENGVIDKEIKTEKEESKETQASFNVRDTLRDPAKSLKRLRVSDYEDECYTRDEASLHLITDSQDSLARRCVCLSTILRNLTFVPGNELEFAKSTTFLSVLGKLLLINHEHPIRTKKQRNYDREEDADFSDSCSSLQGENEWWWDFLVQIRENMLVSIANISGYLDLSIYDEPVSRPVLDGLLHWAVCPSAHGQDPFSSVANNSVLSPQRLALEALCKLCVTDSNVDLVIATPPFSRLEKLCAVLTKHLCKNEDQVLREFSVNLLHYLASSDSAMARTVAKQSPCVSYLVAFIEQAEQTALGVANQHGINFLRENPDSMGTSLDMLRRAAGTLLHLAKHPDNRPLFMQQEQRLLGLVMSHILDQQVALIISRVLYQTSRGSGPLTTTQQIEQSSEPSTQKPEPEALKDSVATLLPPPMPEQKLPAPMNAPSLQHVSSPQLTQMKSPAIPPPSFPPAPSKLLNSSDDIVKSKLNTINKQLPNATVTAPSSAPAIPQTVTASS